MSDLSRAEANSIQQAWEAAGMEDEDPTECPVCSEEAVVVVERGRSGAFWWCYSKCENCGHRFGSDNL